MVGRDRRYGRGRQVSLKAKVGIATAVLVGGGAIGVAAAASSHNPSSASNTGYSWSRHHQSHQMTQSQLLAAMMSTTNTNTVLSELAQLTNVKAFVQTRVGHTVLAAQRGAVVFATRQWIVVQSANGSVHFWRVNGKTVFTNATTTAATNALTANTSATFAAMNKGNMIPATQAVASVPMVNTLTSATAAPQTVTLSIAGTGVTITITVTNNVAKTTMTTGTTTNTSTLANLTAAERSAIARNAIARGDIAVIAGTRANGFLTAKTVVFTATTTPGATTTTPAAGATPTTGATTGASSLSGTGGTKS